MTRASSRRWSAHAPFCRQPADGAFKEEDANVAVVVEDWADDETLAEMEIEPPDTLYGLYRGIDLTRRDSGYGNVLPDTIHIYQGPIEEDCADEDEMADLVLRRRHPRGRALLRPRRRDHGRDRAETEPTPVPSASAGPSTQPGPVF